jgi:hypothetical protein
MRMIIKDGASTKDVEFEANVKRIIDEYNKSSKMLTSSETPASLQEILNAFTQHANNADIHTDGGENDRAVYAYSHAVSRHFALGIEHFTLNQADIDNKHVTLAGKPLSTSVAHDNQGSELILMTCESAPTFTRGVDYCQNFLNHQVIEWGSLALEGVLQAGDRITIFYEKE